jgi:nucleoside 2-deoxyribosyltransferase
MKVYFAHPCFNERQQEFKRLFFEKIRIALDHIDLKDEVVIIDPFEHTPNVECDAGTKLRMAGQIRKVCLQLLDECDIIIALTDGNDTGTAFEAGYAYARNKPIILISETLCSSANAMLIGAARAMIDNVLGEDGMRTLTWTVA